MSLQNIVVCINDLCDLYIIYYQQNNNNLKIKNKKKKKKFSKSTVWLENCHASTVGMQKY